MNKKGKLRAKATNCLVWLFVYSRVHVFWQNEVIFLQLFCSLKWWSPLNNCDAVFCCYGPEINEINAFTGEC